MNVNQALAVQIELSVQYWLTELSANTATVLPQDTLKTAEDLECPVICLSFVYIHSTDILNTV
jgi:hypothetical protein